MDGQGKIHGAWLRVLTFMKFHFDLIYFGCLLTNLDAIFLSFSSPLKFPKFEIISMFQNWLLKIFGKFDKLFHSKEYFDVNDSSRI